MHPRNKHTGRYDLPQLVKSCPDLAAFVAPNPHGDLSVDFSDPAAVMALNRALLASFYGIVDWRIPPGYLCPGIPGRADYIHYAADLLAAFNGGEPPRGGNIRVFDVGAGANCIYPIIGRCEYGWRFVGSETDEGALSAARATVRSNPRLAKGIELRLQPEPEAAFAGVLEPGETFDLSICNPPFNGSLEEAREATRRKWKNLGRAPVAEKNFGGQEAELWCPGGEAGFVGRMIEESAALSARFLWFSSLISKEETLPGVYRALRSAGAVETRETDMEQGQKTSRIVAWTFLSDKQQREWCQTRWTNLKE